MTRKWINTIAGADTFVWVLLGFLVSSFLFFFWPVFLNHEQFMYMPSYVPALEPIGIDMKQFIDYAYAWWKHGDPYISTNAHPPLMHIFFLPAVRLGQRKAYLAITFINLLLFPVMAFVFPLLLKKRPRITRLMVLLGITGLFSYGYQFELERGTFNLITMSICFWSIYIFHAYPRWRYLSYLLFSWSIQLKLYPAVFALMLVRDWRAWKENIWRWTLLGAFNFACLFALGPSVFKYFLAAARSQGEHPYLWPGNASIRAYTLFYNHQWAAMPLLIAVLVCIGTLVWVRYRERGKGFAPELGPACAIAAILIPSVSHDTKLCFLGLPALLFFESIRLPAIDESSVMTTVNRLIQSALLFAMAALYAATLFSYTYKPVAFNLQNSLPVLLSLLVLLTLFSVIRHAFNKPEDTTDFAI